MLKKKPSKLISIIGLSLAINMVSAINVTHAKSYTLSQAITRAIQQDPWITGSQKREDALAANSIAAGTLPDPKMSLAIANLPIDTLDPSQEGMTQFKVGLSQMFPRGKTLALRQQKLDRLSKAQPYERANRRAQVAVVVAHLWLEVLRHQKVIELLETDRPLFEQLIDVAQSRYTATSGRTRQQDIIRAQLELTRLDDRLTRLRLQSETEQARLSEWLNDADISIIARDLKNLPLTAAINVLIEENDPAKRRRQFTELLRQHPKIKSIDETLKAFDSNVQLAKQSYKPQWGLNANYGYRDQNPMGDERADFFSVGVTFDLPVFTHNRQDKKVQSAKADYERVKSERSLVLRELKSRLESVLAINHRLTERQSLFKERLLKEMSDQADASLSAYTHDDGDFAEVVRARIAEINARIDALNLDIDWQKNVAQLNYFHHEDRFWGTVNEQNISGSFASNNPAKSGEHHE